MQRGLALELQALTARHPAAPAGAAPALKPTSLRVDAGEVVAVIGPSGAGKTTLLQALACALRPTEGILQIDGSDPWVMSASQLRALRGRLFLAPQVPPLPPRQRVVTAILAGRLPAMGFWASLRSWVYPSDLAAPHAALERFDLAEKLFERVDRLSGGERQRVGLARALLTPAHLWLVDEPLSALDPARARQAIDTLVGEARTRGVTLIASLHQVELALAHFPRIVALRNGQVTFDLPREAVNRQLLQDLYADHEHELQEGVVPLATHAAEPSPPAVMHCR